MNDLYFSAIEFVQAGLRVFPLHRIKQGACECGNRNCAALGKHPARNEWVKQPLVDESVLDTWLDGELMAPYTGLGWALDAGHIVIDIDPRNGGDISFEKLQADIGVNLIDASSAVVRTGGGGMHLYFAKPDADLAWKMPSQYQGIDIKQGGGYVVIPGSMHASGNEYEWYSAAKSELAELVILPAPLAKLIARARIERTEGDHSDVSIDEISKMLGYLNPDMGHDDWVKIGMAIHRGTAGSHSGFAEWDEWSSAGASYNSKEMASRWASFGRRVSSSVTIATLVSMAKSAGWVHVDHLDAEMTEKEREWVDSWGNWGAKQESTKVEPRQKVTELDDVDLLCPPGSIADLLQYIREKSLFDNKNLALAATLSVASNVVGRGYHVAGRWDGVTANLITLVVAASATGKESAMGTARELLAYAGIGRACHGRIKSDKDLLDTFAHNQYSNFLIDEFGIFLGRVQNSKHSGASYLEGVIGTIMEVYTKANGVLMVDLSRRESILATIAAGIVKCKRTIEDCGKSSPEGIEASHNADYLKRLYSTINDNAGLVNPWLSMFTTATPATMKSAFTREQVESGFLSRAMVFFEHESNPMPKIGFCPPKKIPFDIEARLVSDGFHNIDDTAGRVDDHRDSVALAMTDEAADFLQRMQGYLFEWAEALKDKGMTPLARRATEMVVKVCIAVAGWNRSRIDIAVVRYAARLVMIDIETKIRKVEIADKEESSDMLDRGRALKLKILDICQVWASQGEISTRCRSRTIKKDDVSAVVKIMLNDGLLEVQEHAPKTGRSTSRYLCTDAGIDYMASME